MKNVVTKVLEALLILTMVLILGLFVPFIVSSIVVLATKMTYSEIISSFLFWLFTVAGWIIAADYVNTKLNEEKEI